MSNDWRLTNQMNYLFKKKLIKMAYTPFKEGWEHDHCEFCSKCIDKKTKEAYTTENKYHWICKECFDDFVDMFQWNCENNL